MAEAGVATKVHEGIRQKLCSGLWMTLSTATSPAVALDAVMTESPERPKCSPERCLNSRSSGPKLLYQRAASMRLR